MGWITTHRDKGFTNDEWFSKELLSSHQRILASASVDSVYYAAVEDRKTGDVFALVVPFKRWPRSYENFGWKSMTEHMGPYAYRAPAKVLDKLTETEDKYALEWREACRGLIARAAARPKLAKGDRIELAEALTFSDGETGLVFSFVERNTFMRVDGTLVNLGRYWQDRLSWTKVS